MDPQVGKTFYENLMQFLFFHKIVARHSILESFTHSFCKAKRYFFSLHTKHECLELSVPSI